MEFRLPKVSSFKSPRKSTKKKKTAVKHKLADAMMSLPCEIDHEGAANADAMLLPCVREGVDGNMKVSFLGRGLVGKIEELPANYTGVVFRVGPSDDEDGETGKKVGTSTEGSTFREVVPWCWGAGYVGARGVDEVRDLVYVADLIHRD